MAKFHLLQIYTKSFLIMSCADYLLPLRLSYSAVLNNKLTITAV